MRRTNNRCPQCLVHEDNCFCTSINHLSSNNRLSIILFKKERWLPSNTANLALMSLEKSFKFERGHQEVSMTKDFVYPDGFQPLYLFPSDEAVELDQNFVSTLDKPVNLIVPDGTWRQAKKIHRREAFLEGVPHVKISPTSPSRYTLRRQKYDYGLCTFEAIAEAFKVLEGPELYQLMQDNFTLFLDAHHKNRMIFEPIKKKGIHRAP
ncbi:MAG: hypothetical protein CME62_01260 [Halobacteriovoraceae bacterium]|nr:hypothetical protein [Halobacteriovoraceae bacterium]